MSKSNFSEEFKRDAVRQITETSYPVAEVSQRLGVSQHSFWGSKKKFAASNAKGNDEAEEIRRLKKELARFTEEREILKNRPRISTGIQNEVCIHCSASLAVFGADDVPPSVGSSQWIYTWLKDPLRCFVPVFSGAD